MSFPLSLGFMGRWGRSEALRAFDEDLRAFDLHPKLVPEAVKLTALRILMAQMDGKRPIATDSRAAAELLAYCMMGAAAFSTANGMIPTKAVEKRIDEALESGIGTDAELVLLALHANVIQPSVVEDYNLEAGPG